MILVLRDVISYPLTVIRGVIDDGSEIGYTQGRLKARTDNN
jgi:hypothetical protein